MNVGLVSSLSVWTEHFMLRKVGGRVCSFYLDIQIRPNLDISNI